jgi:hypothetical protein
VCIKETSIGASTNSFGIIIPFFSSNPSRHRHFKGGRMAYEHILYEVRDHILTVTLNRPDRLNAFTPQMRQELIDAFDRADADDAREGITSFLEKRPPRFTDKPSTDMPEFYPWWKTPQFE